MEEEETYWDFAFAVQVQGIVQSVGDEEQTLKALKTDLERVYGPNVEIVSFTEATEEQMKALEDTPSTDTPTLH